MRLKKAKWIEIAMTVILLAAVFVLSEKAAVSVMKVREEKPSEEAEIVTERTDTEKEKEICIVVDSGHGGADPGKVGVNDALEKDINLAIGQKLKKELEEEGIEVIMTRENDDGLYSEDAESKKSQDMKRRCAIIDEHMPVFTVSIHQNSYHEEYVKGAQVFYYSHSDDGKKLAETLQAKLVEHLDPENTRKPKANDSYYLLVHTKSPTVIVECGFLSNREEAALLIQDSYQTKAAQAICEGIMEYLDNYD
ncbi:MAG: N-acetylmuramoyl-L-alanine amidase [bacterium]|nr:N-acetylmuramoyl-L-alanine amidase [bacterium]